MGIPTSKYEVEMDIISQELQQLESDIFSETNLSKKKLMIEKFKKKELQFIKLEIRAEEEKRLHELDLLYEKSKEEKVSQNKMANEEAFRKIEEGSIVRYESIKKWNKTLKKAEKEVLKRDKKIYKMEKENLLLEEALGSDDAISKVRELRYKRLGGKLTKGTLATTAVAGVASAVFPPVAAPLAIVAGVFGILKAGHMATKIVEENGGVKSTVRDVAQLVPQAKGLAGSLAMSYTKKRGIAPSPQHYNEMVG